MQFVQIKTIIKKKCKENGIKFYHGRGKTVKFKDDIPSNGYFYDDGDKHIDYREPTLAVATNINALDTLIHESCHMDQYLEQAQVWVNLDGADQIWQWISGVDGFTKDELDQSVLASYEVELDCERRSIKRHKEWKTGKNMIEYVQKANAYTMFYFYMREHRVWYVPGKEPYSLKKVWSAMPKTFKFNKEKWYNKTSHLFENCIK